MTRPALGSVLVSLVLLAALVPAGAGTAAAEDFVSVSVDPPAFPTPEQPFLVPVTVSNSGLSDASYDVVSVTVRETGSRSSDRVSDRASGDARLEPGDAFEGAVEVTLNETGSHDLVVHVVLETGDGDRRRVTHPFSLAVNGEHPQLHLATASAVPGEPRTMTITVSNGRDDAVRQLSVAVESDAVSVDDPGRVRATLPSGEEAAFSFTARANETGRYAIDVTVEYTAADGERRRLVRRFDADFTEPDPPREHPQLAVRTESAVAGAWRSLNVTVSNGMDAAVRQVSLAVSADAVTVREGRRVTPTLAAGAARTFSFRARAADSGSYPVTVTLVYTDDGVQRTVSRTVEADFEPPDNPGTVSLTGVDVERGGGVLSISGSAANTGGETVSSVLVTVADAEDVARAQPQPEFFVGTVEASDFVSFDLNARLSNNRTTVPLRVTYVVDGVTRERTVTVDAGPPPADDDGSESGGGRGLLVPAAVVVALLVVVGVWWVRR